MNFEDPLADIMSDGSNDSFFDDPKPKSKPKTPEKKSMTDLFNISDTNTQSRKSDDWLGLKESKETKSPAKTLKNVPKKISFEDDDDDILGGMGFSKRPPSRGEEVASKSSKKLDLLESILGPSKKTEDTEKPKFELDDVLKESKAAKSIPSTVEVQNSGRRGRRSSTSLMDPLGLFSEPKQESLQPKMSLDKGEEKVIKPKTELSKSTPNLSEQALPDWLGGTAPQTPIKQSQSENVLNKPTEENVHQTEINVNAMLTQQKLAHSNIEYQNMGIALQQQESQILMALQLKKYEDNLTDLQMKQQEVLMKQEQQFNLLLERQFAKQQIMENNMRLQQERINNHIQLLIGQPNIGKEVENEEKDSVLNSVKQRQHEEMFLLEESYKKQISLLEESLDAVEKRLRVDVDKLSTSFEEKLTIQQQEHQEEISKYKQKCQDLEIQHLDEIKQIRDSNSRLIEEIKYEHSVLLENIKESKKSESSLLQNSNTYVQKLDSNIEILYANSRNLQEIKNSVESDYGILMRAREESLKAKEQEIILMKSTLEKCRESAEKERAELLSLVRTLETKISEQNQNAREERWTFQQAASTLAARSAAMDREAEFNRAAMDREREQLKTLRESILAEQEKLMLQVTEEKLALAAEKSRISVSSKLISDFDTQKARMEMEAAIQVAKEAAEMADKERSVLQHDKTEIEKLKRVLMDKERNVSLKEIELRDLLREAEFKKIEGDRAISESRNVERSFNERLKDLQNQLATLSIREKKLAEEKIVLARERLSLNTILKQKKRCGLCEADPQKLETGPLTARFEAIDSDIMRLRMEAEDESSLHMDGDV